MLTTDQVAARLGVKPQTIYAYVSRGLLSRTRTDDGRESRFDPVEVDALARRGRPRTDATRLGRVDVSITSAITEVRSNRLAYRGYEVGALCERASFEQVAMLLWTAKLPPRAAFPAVAMSPAMKAMVRSLPRSARVIDRFSAILALHGCMSHGQPGGAVRQSAAEYGAVVINLLVEGMQLQGPAPRSKTASLAARLWPRLSASPVTAARVALLDRALCLLADHELATSTLAVRVAASTRPDLGGALQAGLAAVGGVLHGRAAALVHDLLVRAEASGRPDRVVREALALGSGIAGFGHPVYESGDPRAALLLQRLPALRSRRKLDLVQAVLTTIRAETGSEPNVDYALGALAFCADMARFASSAIFVIARMAGWIAHALEEFNEAPLRFRGRALYIGD